MNLVLYAFLARMARLVPAWMALAGLMLILSNSGAIQASEFRSIQPVLTAAMAQGGQSLAPGEKRVALKPIPRKVAKQAADKIMAAWNGNHMDSVLGKEFFDKSQLSDAMNSKVPRDARLSVLSIQDVQTLAQKTADSPQGRLLVSTVTITLKTQLTFNDPVNGFQRREGTNEYTMRIKQRMP